MAAWDVIPSYTQEVKSNGYTGRGEEEDTAEDLELGSLAELMPSRPVNAAAAAGGDTFAAGGTRYGRSGCDDRGPPTQQDRIIKTTEVIVQR